MIDEKMKSKEHYGQGFLHPMARRGAEDVKKVHFSPVPQQQPFKISVLVGSPPCSVSIQTAHDLNILLKPLALEERQIVFNALAVKAHWAILVTTPQEFTDVLEYLTPAQRDKVFRDVQAKVSGSDFIQTPWDLALVLKFLDPAQREGSS